MIIAVDADDLHELTDHANRGLGTIDLRLDGKLIDNDVRISGCADIAQVSDPWLAGMHG